MKRVTYKSSGVGVRQASLFKKKIIPIARGSIRPEVLKDIGGFGSLFAMPRGFKHPVFVSSADGVGTKIKIAILAQNHKGVGIDAVAMNVNDILCVGAEPLFFLDYIAFSKIREQILLEIIQSLTDGCAQAGCSLIGGETAQMPDMYERGDYDLAGFCVGVVEEDGIIDGSKICPNMLVLGLPSSGLHSNGFSLVRKALSIREQKSMSKALLEPTRIYVKPVLEVLKRKEIKNSGSVCGIAHITGGSFYDKIARILPKHTAVCIDKKSWVVPEFFRYIQRKGNISEREMYHTLNMGIGMVLIIKKERVREIQACLEQYKISSSVIGQVVSGKGEVEIR